MPSNQPQGILTTICISRPASSSLSPLTHFTLISCAAAAMANTSGWARFRLSDRVGGKGERTIDVRIPQHKGGSNAHVDQSHASQSIGHSISKSQPKWVSVTGPLLGLQRFESHLTAAGESCTSPSGPSSSTSVMPSARRMCPISPNVGSCPIVSAKTRHPRLF